MRTFKLLPLATAIALLPQSARACFANIPLEKLVHTEPVIVTGKLGKVDAVELRGFKRGMAAGFITVDRVLKNSLEGLELKPGSRLQLAMPGPGGVRISTDIVFREGQEGVWMLERHASGCFLATYPKDYQPLAKLPKMEELLRVAERSVMVELSCKVSRPSRALENGALIAELYEFDPLLADAAATRVDRKVITPVNLEQGGIFQRDFTLTAERKERRRYYVTVFIHPDSSGGKRLFYADGFNKVCESANFERLELELRPGRR